MKTVRRIIRHIWRKCSVEKKLVAYLESRRTSWWWTCAMNATYLFQNLTIFKRTLSWTSPKVKLDDVIMSNENHYRHKMAQKTCVGRHSCGFYFSVNPCDPFVYLRSRPVRLIHKGKRFNYIGRPFFHHCDLRHVSIFSLLVIAGKSWSRRRRDSNFGICIGTCLCLGQCKH